MVREKLGVSDFPFWGKRQYVQSSHLLGTFLELWTVSGRPPLERIVADFKEQLRSNADFVITKNAQENTGAVRVRWYTKEGSGTVGVLPNGDPVRRRLSDDEADLVASTELKLKERFGSIRRPNKARLITSMVALVKKIHKATLTTKGYGQWFVTRVDLNVSAMKAAAEGPMSANIVREVGGRMTRSTIMLGDEKIASVDFYREPSDV